MLAAFRLARLMSHARMSCGIRKVSLDNCSMIKTYDTITHHLWIDADVVSSGVLWCIMPEDEKNWTRLTLRLPPLLHQRLTVLARGRSLNATIIGLLEEAVSAAEQERQKSYDALKDELLKDLRRELDERFAAAARGEWKEPES